MGFSFAGYAISRRFGRDRGILLVALSGAIVSSTAVTADYARRLRDEPDGRGLLSAGIAVASIVMFVRVQLVALALVPRALPSLALTMAPATLVAVAFAAIAWRIQGRSGEGTAAIANPLGFVPAIILAALVAGLSLAARWALNHFGREGVVIVLTFTGISDVDAAVMTMAGLPTEAIDNWTAGFVLGGAVLANTLAKAIMTVVIGWGHGGMRAALPLFAALAAAAVSLALWITIS